MTSVKLKFRPSTVFGKMGSLYYQIIHNGKVRHVASGCRIYPHEWDAVRCRLVEADLWSAERYGCLLRIKEILESDMERMKNAARELDSPGVSYTVEDVVSAYASGVSSCSLCVFVQSLVSGFRNSGKVRLSETYMSALASFMRFRQGRDIQLRDIVPSVMLDYQIWLKNSGLKMNTVSFYMRVLRTVYNRAVEKGLTEQAYPFKAVYTGVAKTVKRAVSVEAMRIIRNMGLPDKSPAEFARDMFMFSFYTRGMSFVDMAYLKRTDIRNGVLSYRRRKTGRELRIRWEQCMQDIVDRYTCCVDPSSVYLLPIIRHSDSDDRKQYRSSMFKVNRKLKEIGMSMGMSSALTMYVARHSWASIARDRMVPLQLISEGLGHDSEKTTSIYLASVDNSKLDKVNKQIIDAV